MFIRWKTRSYTRVSDLYRIMGHKSYTAYSAAIVESRRIQGKPRLQVLAGLRGFKVFEDGTLCYRARPDDLWSRKVFLEHAEGDMKRLALDESTKAQLRAQLHTVVRPLSHEEGERHKEKERDRYLALRGM